MVLYYTKPQMREENEINQRKKETTRETNILLLLFFVCFIFGVFFASWVSASPIDDKPEIRVTFWKELVSFDPVYATDVEELMVQDALFEGLIRLDSSGVAHGLQAHSWTIDPQGIKYSFKLRDDIFWSDGQPVVAEDFVLAFQRLVDPALGNAQRANYLATPIKNATEIMDGGAEVSSLGVFAPNPKTVVFELAVPTSYFLEILDYPGLVPVPAHRLRKYGEEWSQEQNLVSNGPYQLVEVTDDKTIVVKLRDAKKHPEAPRVAKYILLQNMEEAVYKILHGEVDIVWDLQQQEVNWMKGRVGVQQLRDLMPMTIYAVFNTRNDKLKDRRVRQALNLVIDRHSIAKASSAPVAGTFAVPQMLSQVYDGMAKPHGDLDYDQRLERARMLLDEAGYNADIHLY